MPSLDAEFCDRAVYLPGADALVCADLHLGRDADSNVELPVGEREDIEGRIETLLARFEPDEVVVAGDALHAFDRLPDGVAASLADLAETIHGAGADLSIAVGNHDTMLHAAVAEGIDAVSVTDEHRLGGDGAVVLHGHEPPEADAGLYVCGHVHPAIRIEGQRRPCYLFDEGSDDGADVLVVPAFTRLAAGSLVNRSRRGGVETPLLGRLGDVRPIVRDDDADETFWFPPLAEFRSML
ncbi:putative phosphoesterase [Natronoarchaeum philippinense]|uniref:Putative phosphoesterase n=1 Tax=Natronoarchaeum philippinense TaxID=558529 RepID=A0A285N5A6_NATPI|nr:metallophosphoesterase [Natronoarchaeum philippinense]SNZ04619.1 putative phosphoesterase [Natronoarchaeum philippinense]